MDSLELKSNLIDLESRILEIRNGIFDVASKESRLQEISKQLSSEDVWSDLDLSQKLSKEKASIEKSLTLFLNTEIQVNSKRRSLIVSCPSSLFLADWKGGGGRGAAPTE